MVEIALILLIGLFLLGFVQIPGVNIPNYQLFVVNAHTVTLYEILTIVVVFGMLTFLPRFLRIVVGALLIVWILATFGFIVVKGLPAITIIALLLIVGLHRSFHWYGRYRRRYYE